MGQRKPGSKQQTKLSQDPVALTELVDDYMSRQCMPVRSDSPDMQVMYILYTADSSHLCLNCSRINVRWYTFKQNVDCIRYKAPRAIDDQQADSHADRRICPQPALPQHKHSRGHRGNRTKKVPEHVKQRSANVQIVM